MQYKDLTYLLDSSSELPKLDEDEITFDNIKDIIEAILERAVRDLFILDDIDPDFRTAYSLIFDDNYRIYFDGLDEYGRQKEDGTILSIEDMLSYLDPLDKDYIRWKVKSRLFNDRAPIALKLFGKPPEE